MINIYSKHNIYTSYSVGNNNYKTENINRNNTNNMIYINIPSGNYTLTIKLVRVDKYGYKYEEYKPYDSSKSMYIFEIPFNNKQYISYYFELLTPSEFITNIQISSFGFTKENILFLQDYQESYDFQIEYDLNNKITKYTNYKKTFNFVIYINREEIAEVNSILSDEFYFKDIILNNDLSIENKLIPTSSLNYEHKTTGIVKLSINTIKGKL